MLGSRVIRSVGTPIPIALRAESSPPASTASARRSSRRSDRLSRPPARSPSGRPPSGAQRCGRRPRPGTPARRAQRAAAWKAGDSHPSRTHCVGPATHQGAQRPGRVVERCAVGPAPWPGAEVHDVERLGGRGQSSQLRAAILGLEQGDGQIGEPGDLTPQREPVLGRLHRDPEQSVRAERRGVHRQRGRLRTGTRSGPPAGWRGTARSMMLPAGRGACGAPSGVSSPAGSG